MAPGQCLSGVLGDDRTAIKHDTEFTQNKTQTIGTEQAAQLVVSPH